VNHNPIAHILILGVIYAAFGWWHENTETGRGFVKYLREWKADGWVHGIMVSVSVFILGCCAILALALGLEVVING